MYFRKFILLLIFCCLFLPHIKADTYSNWQETKPNIEDYEQQVRYRYYEEKKEGIYEKVGVDTSSLFAYEDKKDIHYSLYNNWQDNCNVDPKLYDIETTVVYPYQTIEDVSYLKLFLFSDNVKIDSIKIYDNEKEISYKLKSCTNCIDITSLDLTSDSILVLDLKDKYEIQNLKIDINITSNIIIDYEIILSNSLTFDTYSAKINGKSNIESYVVTSDNVVGASYNLDYKYSKDIVEKKYYNQIFDSKVMCRYRNILTYRYNIKKVYYDNNYYSEAPASGLIKDTSDTKIYYRYLIKDPPVDLELEEKDNEEKDNEENIDKKDEISKPDENIIVDTNNLANNNPVLPLKLENNFNISKFIVISILLFFLIILLFIKIKRRMSNEIND